MNCSNGDSRNLRLTLQTRVTMVLSVVSLWQQQHQSLFSLFGCLRNIAKIEDLLCPCGAAV